MRKMNNFVLLLLVLFAQGATAQLCLPAIFTDGMVIQREQPIPVWGWGTPGEKVRVVLANKTKTTKVDKDGKWTVTFPALKAGGPYSLEISDSKTIKSSSPSGRLGGAVTVFIGDVFLFSGQSNQELPIGRCMDNNKIATLASTYTNADVHILKLPQQQNLCKPQDDCKGAQWVTISPETANGIAALSYLVGMELQEAAGVPVGIINSSVGGTRVEAWMSRDNLMQFPEMQKELSDIKYCQTNWRDSVNRVEQAAITRWYADMHAADSIENKCLKQGYDFSTWQPVNIFDKWYSAVQPNGSYWFHNSFVLSAQAALSLTGRAGRESFLLRLGAMKDHDEVYVNGVRVGQTGYQYPPRKYMVPASVLRAGINDVVIHLTSQSGEPNFTLAKAYQFETPDGAILLDKGWTMAIGKTMPRCPSSTYFVDTPVGLYNAMIHPLGPLAIKGMVWYQGEANEGRPYHYKEYLEAMINEWHKQFRGNWHSVIVQLASFRDRHQGIYQSGWCDIRDQQYDITNNRDQQYHISGQVANTQHPTSNTFLSTAIDCGEWNDIHPQDKITISHRVALQLRHHVYHEPIISEGPHPVSCKQAGNELILTFSPETGKLRPVNDGIAQVTGDYQLTINIPAAAQSSSSTYTIVDDPSTHRPLFRYAHDDNPLCTIYNTDGIPAPQFSIVVSSNH